MQNVRYIYIQGAVLLALTMSGSYECLAGTNPWETLPTRVLEIEGGEVAFQSVVLVDTRKKLVNPYFQDYPTKYILSATNENDFPIWVQAEWRVPGKKPAAVFGKIEPSEYSEIFLNIKKIKWDSPIPVDVTIYADEAKSHKLGGRVVTLRFGEEEKDIILQSAKKVNSLSEKNAFAFGKKVWSPMIPGFQEMVGESKPVPGTNADKKLSHDIKLLLWKNQSRRHWDCTHEILGARLFDTKKSMKYVNLPAKGKRLIEEGRARGDVSFEEWQIKSCDIVSTYLVLMGKSPQGGTDVMAAKLSDNKVQ